MKLPELLAPVGSMKKLRTALHFGADAVYLSGKEFGLRAYADNFTYEELSEAVEICHATGKRVYVTVNIFASNRDFGRLTEYIAELVHIGVDAVIVSDPGVLSLIRNSFPQLETHLSTQANTTNHHSVAFWRDIGVKRVVLARELSLKEIVEIKEFVGDSVELEVFIHGAMCVSYSGRCLLSSYLTDRDSNRGECVQACRWEYEMTEVSRKGKNLPLTMEEDGRGTYILNAKDMNTLQILDRVIDTGVASLKIEGRMKSEYYVGTVVKAYRERMDGIATGKPLDKRLCEELTKVNHREYTTGFYLGSPAQCYKTSKPENPYEFTAEVLYYDHAAGALVVEQRNRFYVGDCLETVSRTHEGSFTVTEIHNEWGERIGDAKLVQQKLWLKDAPCLSPNDILRKKREG